MIPPRVELFRLAWPADADHSPSGRGGQAVVPEAPSEVRLVHADTNSEYRVKFDFRVEFTNGGYVEGVDFLLDLAGDSVSDAELRKMIVQSMNLARAGRVTIHRKQVVRRGEHADA